MSMPTEPRHRHLTRDWNSGSLLWLQSVGYVKSIGDLVQEVSVLSRCEVHLKDFEVGNYNLQHLVIALL